MQQNKVIKNISEVNIPKIIVLYQKPHKTSSDSSVSHRLKNDLIKQNQRG